MNSNKYKILIVEDEPNIARFVKTNLEMAGYQTLIAETCRAGSMMVASHMPDLIILDLGLPDRDGTELIREVRSRSGLPILVLSARALENDKVQALDLGANDYVTKPFGTAELVARVRAALRSRRAPAQGSGFRLADMAIDYDRRLVTVAGAEIRLTQTEYNILAYLSQHPGKVLTYTAIIKHIWGGLDEGSVKKLQVNMANIRKKLGCVPGDNRYIINELGVGYRIQDQPAPAEEKAGEGE